MVTEIVLIWAVRKQELRLGRPPGLAHLVRVR